MSSTNKGQGRRNEGQESTNGGTAQTESGPSIGEISDAEPRTRGLRYGA